MDSLLELGRANDGYGLRQHHLVGAVRVQVNTGEKGSLGGMRLQRKSKRTLREAASQPGTERMAEPSNSQ